MKKVLAAVVSFAFLVSFYPVVEHGRDGLP